MCILSRDSLVILCEIVCFTKFAASVVVMLIYIVSRLLRRVIRCILNNCKKLNWPKKKKNRKEKKGFWTMAWCQEGHAEKKLYCSQRKTSRTD